MYGSFFIFGLRSLRPFLLHGGMDKGFYRGTELLFFEMCNRFVGCRNAFRLRSRRTARRYASSRIPRWNARYDEERPEFDGGLSNLRLHHAFECNGALLTGQACDLHDLRESWRRRNGTEHASAGDGPSGTTTSGAGAVMTGVGVMDYGIAAGEGKLRDNYTDNSNVYSNSDLNAYSKSSPRTNVSNNVSNDTSVNQNQSQNQRQSQNQNQIPAEPASPGFVRWRRWRILRAVKNREWRSSDLLRRKFSMLHWEQKEGKAYLWNISLPARRTKADKGVYLAQTPFSGAEQEVFVTNQKNNPLSFKFSVPPSDHKKAARETQLYASAPAHEFRQHNLAPLRSSRKSTLATGARLQMDMAAFLAQLKETLKHLRVLAGFRLRHGRANYNQACHPDRFFFGRGSKDCLRLSEVLSHAAGAGIATGIITYLVRAAYRNEPATRRGKGRILGHGPF